MSKRLMIGLFIGFQLALNAGWLPAADEKILEKTDRYIRLESPKPLRLELALEKATVALPYRLKIMFAGVIRDVSEKTTGAKLLINFAESEKYLAQSHDPGKTGFAPNSDNYHDLKSASLLDYAKKVYRTHRLASGKINTEIHQKGKEIIDLAGGYSNFTGSNRFYEQCILDGSFDAFYDEVCDYGEVPFRLNESKAGYDFAITLLNVTDTMATVEISYKGQGVYLPLDYEPLLGE